MGPPINPSLVQHSFAQLTDRTLKDVKANVLSPFILTT